MLNFHTTLQTALRLTRHAQLMIIRTNFRVASPCVCRNYLVFWPRIKHLTRMLHKPSCNMRPQGRQLGFHRECRGAPRQRTLRCRPLTKWISRSICPEVLIAQACSHGCNKQVKRQQGGVTKSTKAERRFSPIDIILIPAAARHSNENREDAAPAAVETQLKNAGGLLPKSISTAFGVAAFL
jgi:hypothetical protein